MEGRDVMQDLNPDVGQQEFDKVPVEGLVIGPDEHSLIDCPGNAVCLPTHNRGAGHIDAMSCSVPMFIYWGPEMFLKPVSKGPS